MLRPMIYDAGALIAADRDQVKFWRGHRAYLLAGGTPLVPANVLAQVWRDGSRQARVSRLLKGCATVALDHDSARAVGELLGRSRTSDPADGSVALLAAELGGIVVTSDPGDIHHLLDHLDERGKRARVQAL